MGMDIQSSGRGGFGSVAGSCFAFIWFDSLEMVVWFVDIWFDGNEFGFGRDFPSISIQNENKRNRKRLEKFSIGKGIKIKRISTKNERWANLSKKGILEVFRFDVKLESMDSWATIRFVPRIEILVRNEQASLKILRVLHRNWQIDFYILLYMKKKVENRK